MWLSRLAPPRLPYLHDAQAVNLRAHAGARSHGLKPQCAPKQVACVDVTPPAVGEQSPLRYLCGSKVTPHRHSSKPICRFSMKYKPMGGRFPCHGSFSSRASAHAATDRWSGKAAFRPSKRRPLRCAKLGRHCTALRFTSTAKLYGAGTRLSRRRSAGRQSRSRVIRFEKTQYNPSVAVTMEPRCPHSGPRRPMETCCG